MLLRGQITSFTCSSMCIVQYWFRLFKHLLITQATPFTDLASETIIRKNRKFGGRETWKSFCAQFAASHKFQYVTCVLGGLA